MSETEFIVQAFVEFLNGVEASVQRARAFLKKIYAFLKGYLQSVLTPRFFSLGEPLDGIRDTAVSVV